MKDGAPGEVHSLAQTTDGFLWLGTAEGLFRFDGVRFEAPTLRDGSEFPQRNIFSLSATSEGGLWVGFWSGGACYLKDGAIRIYGENDGLPRRAVLAFLTDHSGGTWAATGATGLVRLEGSQWRALGADWGFDGAALSLLEDRNGTIWVGTNEKLYRLPQNARKFRLVADQLRYVMKLAEGPDGTLWMAETSRGIRPVPRVNRSSEGAEIVVGSQSFLIDPEGSVWAATLGSGLRRVPEPRTPGVFKIDKLSTRGETFGEAQGLTGNYMFCILRDREGNIWTGTNVGLDRFRQSPFVGVALPLSAVVTALAPGDKSGVWAGISLNQPLLRIRNATITAPVPRQLNIRTAYMGHNGDVWIANVWNILRITTNPKQPPYNRYKSFSLGGNTEAKPVPLGEGRFLAALTLPPSQEATITPDTPVHAITQEHSGRLWISISGRGTFRLNDESWENLAALGGPSQSASTLLTARDGRVWFGYRKGMISVLGEDRVEVLGERNGLAAGDVLSLGDGAGGVWVGGENSLDLIVNRQARALRSAGESSFRRVTSIVEIPGDGLWFSERRGIIHVPQAELEAFVKSTDHRVAYSVYSMLDGLPAHLQSSFQSAAGARAADGRLWFATTRGVVWIDPKRLSENRIPPLVSITGITTKGHKYFPADGVELPVRVESLQVSYAGLSLTMPERVRFRYRLDGVDNDWQEAGARREAIYTGLSPGNYRFQVMASNDSGVWSDAAAALNFRIAPAWYQTLWFRLLCGAVAVGGVWLLLRLRIRQVTEAVQLRMGERLAERERIARELHDTLLQGVQALVLHFHAAKKQIPAGQPAHQMMEQTLEMADRVLTEARDRVYDLRSEAGSVPELSEHYAAAAGELASPKETSFRVTLVGSPRALNPIVRDEAYWIGREALANAFHHADATSIEAEVQYDARGLRVLIRDNGRGIDPGGLAGQTPGHWGLIGMRERARRIGGRVEFWSRSGAGTEVDLRVPGELAFSRELATPPAGWLNRLRSLLNRHAASGQEPNG